MVVQHNMLAWNANRQFKVNYGKIAKVAENLSSGYRINRAADDAAGLSISEKMRRQIRGLTQAASNAQDGISMVQVADGALNEVQAMLQRGNELAVKAANGTLTQTERNMIDEEIQQLKQGIDEVAGRAVFNENRLFPEYGKDPKAGMANQNYHYELKYRLTDNSFAIGNANADVSGENQSEETDSATGILADQIANELIPNAVKQIFDAFPTLKTATGTDEIDMALDISFIDGQGNTLAYAQCSVYSSGKPVSMLIKVDIADFDDEDAGGTGENAEVLESTIAHELMHSVMQYTLTDGMTGRNGEEFPDWFTEGTAQLAGGGFPTNWNYQLSRMTEQLSSGSDTSQDANIEKYLKTYTVAGRPYGHGYLACAYLGYLASGQSDVTAGNDCESFKRLI